MLGNYTTLDFLDSLVIILFFLLAKIKYKKEYLHYKETGESLKSYFSLLHRPYFPKSSMEEEKKIKGDYSFYNIGFYICILLAIIFFIYRVAGGAVTPFGQI